MIVLVNRFTVTSEPAEFERIFAASSDYMTSQEGFISHSLVTSLRTPTSYINIAYWETAEAHLKVIRSPGFAKHIADLAAVATAEPDLFRLVSGRDRADV